MATSIQRLLAISIVLVSVWTLTYNIYSASEEVGYNYANYTSLDIGNRTLGTKEYIEAIKSPQTDSANIQFQQNVIDERSGGKWVLSRLGEGLETITYNTPQTLYETDFERTLILMINWINIGVLATLIGLEIFFVFYAKKNT